MKKIVLVIFASCLLAQTSPTQVAGKWSLSTDSTHGLIKGQLDVEQDGSKLTATYEPEGMGTLHFTGSVNGNAVSFEMPAGESVFKLTGTIDGDKMSGATSMNGGAWSATRKKDGAQLVRPRSTLGTVTQFKMNPFQVGVKLDSGGAVFLKFGPETQVLRIPPGEQALDKATRAELADIVIGDRVLVSFVAGETEARRIVLVSAGDIAKRNDAEKVDWEKRGVSGNVAAKNGDEVVLQMRTPEGIQRVTVGVTPATKIRRYAPDSVKFAEAEPAGIAEVAIGDQFRARGKRGEDGTRLTAEDVVFGTFLTKLGSITAVNREASEIVIEDLATHKPLSIHVAADSTLKLLPDMRAMFASTMQPPPKNAHGASRPQNIMSILAQLPVATMDNLKVGGSVIVTSTRGSTIDQVTAIMLLANADSLVQMAKQQAELSDGKRSAMDVISSMHGGMLSGPGGLNLPAMLQ
jgi:hypothetical protein